MPAIAKKTTKNQLTLPKAIADRFPGVEYFEVSVEDNGIVLRPVELGRAHAVRRRLARLGLGPRDVRDAIAWARRAR